MTGETDIDIILHALSPTLLDDSYVFCTVSDGVYGDYITTQPIASFQEAEGLTLVITQDRADAHGLAYEGLFRCISLQIHSSLEAIGLTALISAKLAAAGISANMIAGYYHDHVFVPQSRATDALDILNNNNTL
ncbi:MAG: ACT domain-containing protein [Porticoccaceae bacterium]|nr:ACT domain-containing protein [Porticoccaceae bacterium]